MAGEATIVDRIQRREPVSYGDILTLATYYNVSLTATTNNRYPKDKETILAEVSARIGRLTVTIGSWAT